VQAFIVNYGYLAIFVLMLAESACIPVPSELTMLFGGALAGGAVPGAHLNLVLVVAAGVAGNVAGSYLAWGIGRYGGRAAWRRWGRHLLLRNDDIDRAERWFGRHGPKAVFFGRLLPVIRTFISLPAGFAEMPPARFGLYTIAGCIPWTLGLGWAGYAVGRNWQAVASAFHGPTYALAALACILAVAALVVLWRRRHREGTAGGGHFVGGATPRPASRQTSSHGRDTERAPGGSSVGKSDVHAAQPPRA
jgi:membrane protein DedA with SNARE-associated domain